MAVDPDLDPRAPLMTQPFSMPSSIDEEIDALARDLIGAREVTRKRRKIARILIGHRPEGEERRAERQGLDRTA
jgi:hypothetical protein